MPRAWSASERGQQAASLRVLKQMFKGKRTLFGQTVSSPSDFFRAADKSGDGLLDKPEFVGALKRLGLGLTAKQLDELWVGLDADGGGTLDYREAVAMMSASPPVRIRVLTHYTAARHITYSSTPY
jgi:hypothetical protein